jgi:hypothetical protein
MPSVWCTNYHNCLCLTLGWVFVHFLLSFYSLNDYLTSWELNLKKINTVDESRMVKIVGNQFELVKNRLNRSKNWFWIWVNLLGLNREYSRNILQLAAWWLGSARLKTRLNGLEAWLLTRLNGLVDQLDLNMARSTSVVLFLWACGWLWICLQRCKWNNTSFNWDDLCTVGFETKNPIVEESKCVFTQLWKFRRISKTPLFLKNEALIPIVGGRDHKWWFWNIQGR